MKAPKTIQIELTRESNYNLILDEESVELSPRLFSEDHLILTAAYTDQDGTTWVRIAEDDNIKFIKCYADDVSAKIQAEHAAAAQIENEIN